MYLLRVSSRFPVTSLKQLEIQFINFKDWRIKSNSSDVNPVSSLSLFAIKTPPTRARISLCIYILLIMKISREPRHNLDWENRLVSEIPSFQRTRRRTQYLGLAPTNHSSVYIL